MHRITSGDGAKVGLFQDASHWNRSSMPNQGSLCTPHTPPPPSSKTSRCSGRDGSLDAASAATVAACRGAAVGPRVAGRNYPCSHLGSALISLRHLRDEPDRHRSPVVQRRHLLSRRTRQTGGHQQGMGRGRRRGPVESLAKQRMREKTRTMLVTLQVIKIGYL